MASDYPGYGDSPRRGGLGRVIGWLLLVLVVFVAGVLAAALAVRDWEPARRYLLPEPVAAPAPALPASAEPVSPPAPTPLPPVDQRLAAVEQRLAQVDLRARAAVGNAGRAEGLLIAFAARRALDRGVDLGYIEGLLRERFGGSDPQAVATIISAARQPVTLAGLRTGLAEAAPRLAAGADVENEGAWAAFKRELSGLVVVRRQGVATTPADHLERATRALDAGEVEQALASVARLPARALAAKWIGEARRYVAARNALDRIETTALLTPEGPAVPADAPAPAMPEPAPAA